MNIKRDYLGMFDALKGFLLFVIVFSHHYSFFNGGLRKFMPDAPVARFCDWSALTMGLFFVIAGYQYRSAKTLSSYIQKQTRQLIVPYFAALTFTAALKFLFHYLTVGELRIQEISTILAGACYGVIRNTEILGVWAYSINSFWFLPTFFFSGLFFQMLKRFPERYATACILALTVLAVYMPDASHFQFPWFLVQSCGGLGFMELGHFLKKKQVLYQKVPIWFAAAAICLYVGCHVFSSANMASNIWRAGVVDYLAACGMSVIVLRLYLKWGIGEWRCLSLLEYVGMNSLLFFLVHGVGLLVIPWEAPLGERIMGLGLFAGCPVWLVGVILYLVRCLGILCGCLGLSWLKRIRYKVKARSM